MFLEKANAKEIKGTPHILWLLKFVQNSPRIRELPFLRAAIKGNKKQCPSSSLLHLFDNAIAFNPKLHPVRLKPHAI